MGFFSRYREIARIRGTDTYKDMMKSTDRLAVAACALMAKKSASELKEIMSRTEKLAGKLHDAIDHETPLIAGITLLTALQALDSTLQHESDDARRGM